MTGQTPPRMLVAGLGNPDRGDDGLGALVISQLAGRLPANVRLMTRRGDMLALLDDWAECDVFVAVDAAAPGGEPGRIYLFDLAVDALPPDTAYVSGHALGLPAAIELGRALGRLPRSVIVYAVEGQCFDAGAPVSDAVARAAGEVARRIEGEGREGFF